MKKTTIKDLDIQNKKLLIRVDFNVPLKKGEITDDSRIKRSIETIDYATKNNSSIVLISHLGRPKGKYVKEFSLEPCLKRLEKILKTKIKMASSIEEAEKISKILKPKEIMLVENLRFYEAEEKPDRDPSFAKKLSTLADIYINDAFSVSHRDHSSITRICNFFSNKAIGLLFEKEIKFLSPLIKSPEKPFFAILGGAKISTKIGVISKLLEKVDSIFIGGGMSYSFFKAKGIKIGASIYEEDVLEEVKTLIKKNKNKINLPSDIVIADKFDNNANKKTILSSQDIDKNWMGMDIGEKTIKDWEEKLKKAKTIFINGPLGVFEMENFANGTNKILKTIANLKSTKIAGGGDSLYAINLLNLNNKFTYLSTGGGATLKYLEDETLIGLKAISDEKRLPPTH